MEIIKNKYIIRQNINYLQKYNILKQKLMNKNIPNDIINYIIDFNGNDEIFKRQKFLKSGLNIQIRLLNNTLFKVSHKINKSLNIIYLKKVSPCLKCKKTNTYKEVCDVCFKSSY